MEIVAIFGLYRKKRTEAHIKIYLLFDGESYYTVTNRKDIEMDLINSKMDLINSITTWLKEENSFIDLKINKINDQDKYEQFVVAYSI